MPVAGFVKKNLKQDAVYWGPGVGDDDGFGVRTFASAIQIKVRWEDVQQMSMDAEGKEFVSMATVYTDRELENQGWLLLGVLTSLPSDTTDPKSIADAFEIRNIGKSSRLKKPNQFIYKVLL